jgi:hypothetical protein
MQEKNIAICPTEETNRDRALLVERADDIKSGRDTCVFCRPLLDIFGPTRRCPIHDNGPNLV